MKALFIVFEGIDGSGTSTQAELLNNYFIAQGKKTVVTPEPTSGPVGKLIRQILNNQELIFMPDTQRFDEQMSYLFAADRYYHLHNQQDGVLSLLKQNINVISTRYYFSSLAYHCQDAHDFNQVKILNQNFPNPDLVIYIDIPVKDALIRLQEREHREVYEYEEKLIKVKSNYQDIFKNYPNLLVKIDGKKNVNNLHKNIVEFIINNLN